MEALREMFPNRGEGALRSALDAANGDVAAAAEFLLPPVGQVARDEALARSLQAAEIPTGSAAATGNRTDDGWTAVTQPVLDGLAAAADAAKAAVQYVAAEITAATNAVGPVDNPSPAPRRVIRERHDDSSVVTGGAGRSGDSSLHMRGRSARTTAPRGTAAKED